MPNTVLSISHKFDIFVVMLCALCSSHLLGQEPTASFAAVRYLEQFEGRFEAAADLYERMYVGRPPWQNAPRSKRFRAALRAGDCYERVGKRSEALVAYRWLAQRARDVVKDDELRVLVRTAVRRLRELDADDREAEVREAEVRARDRSLVRTAVVSHAASLSSQVKSGRSQLVALERTLREAQRRYALLFRLHAELEERDALAPVAEPVLLPPLVLSDVAALLPEMGAFEFVADVAAGGLSLAGLRALADGQYQDGRERIRLAADLSSEERNVHTALAAQQETAFGGEQAVIFGGSSDFSGARLSNFAAIARRNLADEKLRRVGSLQIELRALLRDAEEFLARPRPDYALERLARLREQVSWSPPELAADAEIESLDRKAQNLYDEFAAGIDRRDDLTKLWEVRRLHVRMATAMLGELVVERARLERSDASLRRRTPLVIARAFLHEALTRAEVALAATSGALRAEEVAEIREDVGRAEIIAGWSIEESSTGSRRRLRLLNEALAERAAMEQGSVQEPVRVAPDRASSIPPRRAPAN